MTHRDAFSQKLPRAHVHGKGFAKPDTTRHASSEIEALRDELRAFAETAARYEAELADLRPLVAALAEAEERVAVLEARVRYFETDPGAIERERMVARILGPQS